MILPPSEQVKFLHPVGVSTCTCGITIPKEAQTLLHHWEQMDAKRFREHQQTGESLARIAYDAGCSFGRYEERGIEAPARKGELSCQTRDRTCSRVYASSLCP